MHVPIQKFGKYMKADSSWRQAHNRRETSGTELCFIFCCPSCLWGGVGRKTLQESWWVNTAFWNRAGSWPTVCPHPGSRKKLYEGWMKPGNQRKVSATGPGGQGSVWGGKLEKEEWGWFRQERERCRIARKDAKAGTWLPYSLELSSGKNTSAFVNR